MKEAALTVSIPENSSASSNKVPEVTLAFWVIKIAATTLGETGGDALSMTLNLGYALSTLVLFGIFVAVVWAQIVSRRFHPFLYWTVIVATTTVGTTMADFADRSLGVGYVGGSLILFAILMATLAIWKFAAGSLSVNHIVSPKAETFYWLTILFSNTLGTALGDFLADSGLGYQGAAVVFAGLLALIAAAYFRTRISHTLLFWMAFILTRPLGATVGDMLTKPHADGGLDLGRITSSAVIAVFIIGCIALTSQAVGGHPGTGEKT
ncbi:COG4705 family protein [Bradyrhizobium sp.]